MWQFLRFPSEQVGSLQLLVFALVWETLILYSIEINLKFSKRK